MRLPLREAVRGLVVDHDGRVLLVRFRFPDGDLWAAPGGGVEPGESHESALRRELREEVGLYGADIGPPVWTRSHVFPLSPQFGGQRETFYLVRAPGLSGAPAFSEDELRAEGLVGSRWWTVHQLQSSQGGRFAPKRLPDLYEALLVHGPPDTPLDTGE